MVNRVTPKRRRIIEDTLRRLNTQYGRGMVAAIVWGVPFAGMSHSRQGVVVRQMQYGMDATEFSVAPDFKTVRYLSRDRYILDVPKPTKEPALVPA